MIRRNKPVLPLLALTLALLATGFAGCKKGTQDEPAGAQKNAPAAAEATSTPPPAQAQAADPGAAPGALPASGMPPLGGTPSPAAPPVDPAKLPAVVARINGQDIKKEELLQGATEMRQQLAQMQGVQAPLNAQFYKQVLDGLVARTLLQQEAKAQNVTVTEEEITQQLNGLRSRAPNPEAFQKALAANGLTEEKLRQQIRRDGAVQKLVQTRILSGVTVSDQQAKEFYDKNQEKMKRPERLHLRQLVVESDAKAPAADRQQAKAKAEEFLKRAQKGEDMTKIAQGDAKVHAGDAWLARGQAPPLLENAAFALSKPNDLTPVLESPVGYHVLQLLEREAPAVAPFDVVKGQITEFIKQRLSQEKLASHVQELKAKGKVETFM
jgi:parvulin-like peptidyl-prolyl isomerase